ncbi:MAG: AbrB family transcriptional regulator [Pseudomonadota bacterium]
MIPQIDVTAWSKRLAFLAAATGAGFVASFLGIPLPWMIGPLLLTGAVGLSNVKIPLHPAYRPIGQLIVATAVGLYFTPAALHEVVAQAGLMIGAAVLTIAAGIVTAILLYRLTRCDGTVAFFASMPGGPAEMAVLAERWGAPGAPVIFAQTLRIVFIVLSIPAGLVFLAGLTPPDIRPTADVYVPGLVLLYALAAAGTVILNRIGVPNCNFLGPLAVAALISAVGFELSGVPMPLLAAGQIILGIALGSRFTRDQFRRDQKFAVACVFTTVVLLLQCAAVAIGLWLLAGDRALPSYLLATAPGSVTEMALTAKLLAQGVAMVTAYHLVRIFIIIPLAPLLYRVFRYTLRDRVEFGEPAE